MWQNQEKIKIQITSNFVIPGLTYKYFFKIFEMNVTRKNFAEHLPEILAKIEAADLVAIDLEFTGLPNDKDFNQLDTREERYQKTAHQMAMWFI